MIRVSNSLDPDQARQNVLPDLGLNCLQKLPADNNRIVKVKQPAFSSPKRQLHKLDDKNISKQGPLKHKNPTYKGSNNNEPTTTEPKH